VPWWMRPTAEVKEEHALAGRYRILEEGSRTSLETAVNAWLERGAEVVGGLMVLDQPGSGIRWIQAVLVSNSTQGRPKGEEEGR
jgi:hypothetical protein